MITPGHVSTPGDCAPAAEDLVVVRAAVWRFLVPIRFVRRIHPAALPTARPAPAPVPPVIAVEGELLPVAFAASLGRCSLIIKPGTAVLIALCGPATLPTFGSHVSMWLGPPFIQRRMTCFAFVCVFASFAYAARESHVLITSPRPPVRS